MGGLGPLRDVVLPHPGGNPGANLKSISHRCHPILVAFVWELTQETINLLLGCLQGGEHNAMVWVQPYSLYTGHAQYRETADFA